MGLLLRAIGVLGCLSQAIASPRTKAPTLPFRVSERTLPNGLRVIEVPTKIPNAVSLHIVVRAGSRNEVEPGKKGIAHLFEHMMFRGTKAFPEAKAQRMFAEMGAEQNAYTSSDFTNYHTTFLKRDLETILQFEADRFQNLKYSRQAFQTEAGVIAGEYRRITDPGSLLYRTLLDTAFQVHSYKHEVIGTERDIDAMPKHYRYSREFFTRHYRPNNTTLVIAGDLKAEKTFDLVEKHFGSWRRAKLPSAEVPREPSRKGPRTTHVAWPEATPPLLTVAFHRPGFSARSPTSAALALLLPEHFGLASDVYKRLVLREQKITSLDFDVGASRDPGLVTVTAQLKDVADAPYVRDEILRAFRTAGQIGISQEKLSERRKALQFELETLWNGAEAVAGSLAARVHESRSVEVIPRYLKMLETISPEQIRRTARRVFRDKGLVVASLSHEPMPEALGRVPRLRELVARPRLEIEPRRPASAPSGRANGSKVDVVEMRNNLRRVDLQLRFDIGAAHDPPGKEGLAALAAEMLVSGGSRSLTTEQINEALDTVATAYSASVRLDRTVFRYFVHPKQWRAFADVVMPMLTQPGLRAEDFERVKQEQMAQLQQLRDGDEASLAMRRATTNLYSGTRFGHTELGTESGLRNITLADVSAFVRKAYRQPNLRAGTAGSVPKGVTKELGEALGSLPGKAQLRGTEAPHTAAPKGLRVELVEKDVDGTAIALAMPVNAKMGASDYVALYVASHWLGGGMSGKLFDSIRSHRGLSYGAYSGLTPDGRLLIQVQPVDPANAAFALRAVLREVDELARAGLAKADFVRSRQSVLRQLELGDTDQASQLDARLESQVMGVADYRAVLREQLGRLTVEDVQRALERHVKGRGFQVVMIGPDAAKLKAELRSGKASTVRYDTAKPSDVLTEDRVIGRFPLQLESDIAVTPIGDVYK